MPLLVTLAVLEGCASIPPGAGYPKTPSTALASPEDTHLGARYDGLAREMSGQSGFRILSTGVDGLLIRVQLIEAAEKTLDLQYFIFRGDETGRLLTDAVLRAADRGVRVRVLVDDGATIAGDEQLMALDAHPNVQIRVFNPFSYRGHNNLRRGLEFVFHASRLDYRMHNKLLIVDNAVALIGGRNIGNQYFQIDPNSQFADDDVYSAGPIAAQLSTTFDEFWNSRFAIPAAALDNAGRTAAALALRRVQASEPAEQHLLMLETNDIHFSALLASGEPLAGIISGQLPLVWAPARVISDSPDKKNVESGNRRGRLMARSVAEAARAAQSELLMVTPYLVPTKDERQLLHELRQRAVAIRILTNSLVSTPDPIAHSGYVKDRIPLLKDGVELYELRALLGNTRGSGQSARVSSFGNYSLHAKLFVFDRERLFIGSMNFDQRSKHLNTEIGLMIDSPELALQTVARFDHMVMSANAYAVAWRPSVTGGAGNVEWSTAEDGEAVVYNREPARSYWQRLEQTFYSCLPISGEL